MGCTQLIANFVFLSYKTEKSPQNGVTYGVSRI